MNPSIIIESILQELNLEYVREYKFHPKRRFRFDFAVPRLKLAIEQEGGIHVQGRHVRGMGYENDCVKYNLAALEGWILLRYTTNQIRKNPAQVYNDLKYLKERGA